MGELRKRGDVWWIRYYRGGRRYEESSGSRLQGAAVDLLKLKEGDGARGVPVTPKVGRLRFEEAAADLVTEYRINDRRSIDELQRRIEKHLAPFFGGRKMAQITTADVRAYVAARQAPQIITRRAYDRAGKGGAAVRIAESTKASDGASNGEINRELTTLKRIFSLAVQAGKLLHRPHIPMLREDNTRVGFFEPEQFSSVLRHLPEPIQPVATFAYITGWRIDSEVLPIEWRQVDLVGGEVRLDAGRTKNREGRVFPLTDDMRALIERQLAARDRLKAAGELCPWVFFRLVARGRGGAKHPKPIRSITKAWAAACLAAGCPGRIPHDLRRTAVRNMVRRGVPERVAMKLTGHKTRSIFERYNIVSDGDLRTAAVQLAGLTGTIQGQSEGATASRRGESSRFAR